MSIRLASLRDRLRTSLWFIPVIFVGGAVAAALVVVPIDRLVDGSVNSQLSGILFGGGPESARLVLATIAAAMLTFTALVYTVTMLVLQLASSQLSPRVMRTFLRDRTNQAVLGLFVATFIYSLLVLREVRSQGNDEFVPAIGVTVAYVLLISSVGAFIFYIHHMAQSIRAATVLRSVADETRQAIERLYPEGIGDEPAGMPPPVLPEHPPDAVIAQEGTAGVITAIDDAAILRLARDHALCVELPHMVGDFVPSGAPILRVWRTPETAADRDLPLGALAKAIHFGPERTMTQDAAFGFRQIVDIAERALSPGTNDPTTAVQALDEIHDLLRRLARRHIPSSVRVANDGAVLLRLPRPEWADYVSLALDEIRLFGAGSIQVSRRVRYLLLDLLDVAPGIRRAPLERQLRLFDAALPEHFASSEDRQTAAKPSATGQGPPQGPPTGDPAAAG